MKKCSSLLFALFGTLMLQVLLQMPQIPFSVLAAGKTEFEMKRYDFQQQKPKIVLEHFLMDKMEPEGKIIGSYLKAAFLRDDDLIYIKLKNPSVSVGDHFMIYANNGAVAIPGKFGQHVGQDIAIKGYAEITKVVPHAIVAKIYNAVIDINVGDFVAAPVEQNLKIMPKEPKKMVKGQVLRSVQNLGLIGPYDFVYINRGSADGLEMNDRLYGYRTTEGLQTLEAGRPPVNMAEIVVVNLGEHVATAYVLTADDSFLPGTFFKSAISDIKFLSDSAAQDLGEATTTSTQIASEERKDSSSSDEEEAFDITKNSSYFQAGPGIFMKVTKKGVLQPYFSVMAEWGMDRIAIPITFGIINSHSQEFKIAPRAQMEWFPFSSFSKLAIVLGGGIAVNYSFDTLTTLTTLKYQEFELGIEALGAFKYFVTENMFSTFAPLAIDGYFWKYRSTQGTSATNTDFQGQWNVYLTLGFTF